MSKRDAGSGSGRVWVGYAAAVAVGAAVLILVRVRAIAWLDLVQAAPGSRNMPGRSAADVSVLDGT